MPRLLLPFSARPGEPEFERAVFASRASTTDLPFAQLESFGASAARHNPPGDLYAAVLYQSGWFLYWLEGPSPALRAMVERVKRDKRHHSFQAVHNSSGRRFLFSPWSTGLLPSMETPEELGERVAHMRYLLTRGFQFAPTSVIRRLSAPFGVTFQKEPSGVEGFHRVGVCAARGLDAFEFVRWVAAFQGHAVATRRLAGDRAPDSGSEYTELHVADEPVRIVSIARNALLQGLSRAFLCDWPHLVLLFCGDARYDLALMARVLAAFADLPVQPALLCVAPDEGTHQQMAAQAEAAGIEYHVLSMNDSPRNFQSIWHHLAHAIEEWGHPEVTIWPLPDERMIS